MWVHRTEIARRCSEDGSKGAAEPSQIWIALPCIRWTGGLAGVYHAGRIRPFGNVEAGLVGPEDRDKQVL